MAQRRYNPSVAWIEDKEALKPEDNTAQKIEGTAARTTGGLVVPTLIRLGAGLGGFAGPVVGGATSGLGEIIAQKIEAPGKAVNWPRVGVEAAIGAVPFGKFATGGKALRGLALGTGLAGAGIVGRKATSEEPGSLSKWDASDAVQLALGGGLGAAASKIGPKSLDLSKPAEKFEHEVGSALGKAVDETPRLQSKGIRVGTEPSGKPIYDLNKPKTLIRPQEPEVPAVAEAKQRAAASTTKPTALPADVDRSIEAASDVSKAQRTVSDKGDKAFVKRIVEKEKAATAADKLKTKEGNDMLKAQTNAFAMKEKETAESAANRRVDTIMEGLEKKGTVGRKVAAKNKKGVKTTVTETFGPPAEEVADAAAAGGGSRPAAPVAAAPTEPPVVPGKGGVAVAEPEAQVAANALAKAEAEAQKPAFLDPEAIASGRQLERRVANGEADVPTIKAPKAPLAGVPFVVTNASKAALRKLGFTSAQYNKMTPQEVQDALKAGAAPAKAAAPAKPEPLPVAEPVASTPEPLAPAEPGPSEPGVKLSVPLAVKVAQASQAPAGQTFARFFRNRPAAELANEYKGILPKNVQDLLEPILAQYEAQTRKIPGTTLTGKAATNPKYLEAGNLLRQMREELNLPTRGARTVGPKAPPKAVKPVAPEAIMPEAAAPATQAAPEVPAAPPQRPGKPPMAEPSPETNLAALRQRINDNEAYIKQIDADPEMDDITKELFRREALAKHTELQRQLLETDPNMSTAPSIDELLKRSKGEAGAIDPELARLLLTRGGPAIGGAMVGSAADDEHPVRGALIGGGLGLAAGMGAGAIASNPDLSESVGSTLRAAGRKLPNFQRFNMLAEPKGLTINAGFAPWGAGVMGSIERIGQGLAERGLGQADSGALDTGKAGMKELVNPSYLKRLGPAWQQAKELVEGVNERGEMLMGDAPTRADKVMSVPSTIMATGDIATRNALMDAGLSEDAARAITLTANPRTKAGEAIVNFAKHHPVTGLLMPFSRTAVNSVESAMERLPIFQQLYNSMLVDPADKADLAKTLAMYGVSAGVAKVAYEIGQNVDPDTAKTWQIPKLISNMAGQYGSIAATAYAAGVASAAGKDSYNAAGAAAIREIPLPATNNIVDTFQSLGNYVKEGAAHPNATGPFQKYLPNIAVPGILRDTNLQPATDALQRYNRQLQWQE